MLRINKKKSLIFITIFLLIIIFAAAVIILADRKTEDTNEEKEQKLIAYIIDFSKDNNNTSQSKSNSTLTKSYYYEKSGITFSYPEDWVVNIEKGCFGNSNETECINVSKGEYSLKILNMKGNYDFYQRLGGGYIDSGDLEASYHFYVDGINMLRYKYVNGLDEEGRVISIIESIVDDSSFKEEDALGYSSLYTFKDNNIYEIVYTATPGLIENNEELDTSEYIKTMDMILQSIDWDAKE